MYQTNASYELLVDCFMRSDNYKELSDDIKSEGHWIDEYRPTIKFNFDDK